MAKQPTDMMQFVRATVEDLKKRRRVPTQEKRAHNRYDIWQETKVVVLHPTTTGRQVGDAFVAYLRNVSRSGMGFLCAQPFARDEVVGLRLQTAAQTRWVWASVMRCDEHTSLVETRMMRLCDVGARFCADYQQHLTDGLTARNRMERHRFGRLLAECADAESEQILIGLLGAKSPEVRCEAHLGLSQIGGEDAVRRLVGLLGRGEMLEISAGHPWRPVLVKARLLHNEQNLPQDGDTRLTVEVDGVIVGVAVRREAEDRYLAWSLNPQAMQASAASREEAVERIRLRLAAHSAKDRDAEPGPEARHVFVSELAAFAISQITQTGLPLDATADSDQRAIQRQAYMRHCRQWVKARQDGKKPE
jgi:HEAT repeat protein